jgi:hypothetical protein
MSRFNIPKGVTVSTGWKVPTVLGAVAAAAPFAPTDITGLQFWTKADGTLWQESTRSTPATADDDPVGSADDLSGNGKHAIQATAGARATLKTNIQNSKPILRFDGTADNLLTASIAHGIGTGNFYVATFVIVRSLSAAYKPIWANISFAPGLYARNPTTNNFAAYFGGDRVSGSTLLVDTPYVLEFWRDTGVIKFAVNAVQGATTHALATSMADAQMALGTALDGSFGQVDIGELLFVSAFPSAQQAAIRTYLNGRWAAY